MEDGFTPVCLSGCSVGRLQERHELVVARIGQVSGQGIPYSQAGCFVWRPRLVNVKDRALSVPEGDVFAMYTDASADTDKGLRHVY